MPVPFMATDARFLEDLPAKRVAARHLHDLDIVRSHEICGAPRGHVGIEFDRRYPAKATNKSMQSRHVIAVPGTDMHNVLARLRSGIGEPGSDTPKAHDLP